tara:strand:- start:1384 stop:2127 length:744 start_codon:yes stop_codon:yes gene_type:complete
MSYANSRIPVSAQQGVHDGLEARVRRHFEELFRKPCAAHSQAAFEHSLEGWDGRAPLILDAGCGVGHSTIELARSHPDHWVIGVDRSEDRLARRKPYPQALLPRNMVFVRADLVDYWRLFHAAGLRPAWHWLLYPNPWPKIGHVARRWPAHPVFPYVLAPGGRVECRTNWRVYADEFALAAGIATGRAIEVESFEATTPLTPFERKYRDSGQPLYRVAFDADDLAPSSPLALWASMAQSRPNHGDHP